MRLYALLGGLVLSGLPAMASAHHSDVHIGFGLPVPSFNIGFGHGFGYHGYYGYRGPIVRGYFGPSCYFGPSYYYPPVVYSAPPVVYSAPAPVYVAPQQTYVAPAPQAQPQYYPAPAPQTYYYGR